MGQVLGSGAGGPPPVPSATAPQGANGTNPLAQMLLGLGSQYKPADTRWGLPGDRLLRYTPQNGNAGMAANAGLGKGGAPGMPTPPGGAGTPPGGAGAGAAPPPNPGVTGGQQQIPGGSIDWDKLVAPPPGNPQGAPAINQAMQGLGQNAAVPGMPAGAQGTSSTYGPGTYMMQDGTVMGAPGSQFAKMYPTGLKTHGTAGAGQDLNYSADHPYVTQPGG